MIDNILASLIYFSMASLVGGAALLFGLGLPFAIFIGLVLFLVIETNQ